MDPLILTQKHKNQQVITNPFKKNKKKTISNNIKRLLELSYKKRI